MMPLRRLRWWIIALVCLGTMLNYLARNSLGVLAPTLTKELAFTTQQYAYVVASFQVAYTVMQPRIARSPLGISTPAPRLAR